MNKHAYLILVHNNFKTLEKLLELLDDERNDIYIHVDKKIKNFDFKYFSKLIKKSKIYFTKKRIDIRWGDISQIQGQFCLMKEANKNEKYEYYHLISGVDLPIKSQDYIHEFFEKNYGTEFIYCTDWDSPKTKRRYANYHIFTKFFRCKNKVIMYLFDILRESFIKFQQIIGYDRTKKYNFKIMYGSEWWSIENDLIEALIKNEGNFYKIYNHTRGSDEHYIQTFVYNSEFRDRLSSSQEANMRYIRWDKKGELRGSPYTFKISDYNELIESDKLFARKFDENVDFEIIEKIYEYFTR